MADEDKDSKTEDPTQKRLDDAIDKGDVAKSQEVNTWFVIAGSTLLLSSFSGSIGSGIEVPMRNLMMNAHQIRVDGPGLLQLAKSLEFMLIAALGIPLLLLLIAGVASNLVQHRLVWSSEPLIPKFSKISPMAGAARLFGKQALANFLKGLFKVIALGIVMVLVLWPERHRVDAMVLSSVVRATEDVAAGDQGRIQAIRGRPAHQGSTEAIAICAREKAHDGGGSNSVRDHHQPDALRSRVEIRTGHAGTDLRRQRHRRAGAQDQGNRRRP